MGDIFSNALNIVLPIFLVAAVGYFAARVGWISDSRALARATLFLFSPALVLTSLLKSQLDNNEFVVLLLFVFGIALVLSLATWLLARSLRLDNLSTSALLLSTLVMNAGNYGIPLSQLAFGDAGVARAAIYFVGNTILAQTAGVYIASRGHASPLASIRKILEMPLIYAAVAGLVLNRMHWTLPPTLGRPLDLLSAAAIPVMLIILGVELAHAKWQDDRLPVSLAGALKLLGAPLAALALAQVLNLQGLTRNVAILQSSMPTAVTASLLAVEFSCKPKWVSGVILLTTVGSLVTLPLLLSWLR